MRIFESVSNGKNTYQIEGKKKQTIIFYLYCSTYAYFMQYVSIEDVIKYLFSHGSKILFYFCHLSWFIEAV